MSKEEGTRHKNIEGRKTLAEIDTTILRQRLNWSAQEAEISNLRSEALFVMIMRLEAEISSIRESIKMVLQAEIEIHREVMGLTDNPPHKEATEVNTAKYKTYEATELTNIDEQVLSLLSTGTSMTAREIQNRLNRSREHTSRLLGRLVDIGILKRNRVGRQFVYNLMDKKQSKV